MTETKMNIKMNVYQHKKKTIQIIVYKVVVVLTTIEENTKNSIRWF